MHIKKPFTNNDLEIVNEQKTVENIKAWLLTAEDRCTTEETWQCLQELKDILEGNIQDYYLPKIDNQKNKIQYLIKQGLENGIVCLNNTIKPYFPDELYCSIGDVDFYFEEDFDKRFMSKEEYFSTYSLDEIAASISKVFESKEIANEKYAITEEEYNQCIQLLSEKIKDKEEYEFE